MLFLMTGLVLFFFMAPFFAQRITQLVLFAYGLLLVQALVSWPAHTELFLMNGLTHLHEGMLLNLVLLLVVTFLVVLGLPGQSWETYYLLLGGFTGALYLISSQDWLLVLISFELLNLSTYLFLSFFRGTEASTLKYLLLSALFTTILFFAISAYYSITGSTAFDMPFDVTLPKILILLTITFKLGLAPLHSWVADVYHGLPWQVLLWLATIPKLALFMWLPEIPFFVPPYAVLGVAILSIVVAALMLPAQTTLKGFVAYSGIGHTGLILTGLVLGNYWFYLFVYFFTTLNFLFILQTSRVVLMKDLNTLLNHKTLAFAFAITLLSMGSIPPFAGFYAKCLILVSLLDQAFWPLALIVLLASIRTTAYYLNLVQCTFFKGSSYSYSSIPVTMSMATTIAVLTTLFTPFAFLLV